MVDTNITYAVGSMCRGLKVVYVAINGKYAREAFDLAVDNINEHSRLYTAHGANSFKKSVRNLTIESDNGGILRFVPLNFAARGMAFDEVIHDPGISTSNERLLRFALTTLTR